MECQTKKPGCVDRLQEYHLVWLQYHPHRTPQWLANQLADSFAMHHVDGNHANNAPENLVLIDASDHMMIHAGKHASIRHKPRIRPRPRKERSPDPARLALGNIAYQQAQSGLTWKAVGQTLGVSSGYARRVAILYAQTRDAPWPPPATLPIPGPPRKPAVTAPPKPKPTPKERPKPKRKPSRRGRAISTPTLSPTSMARVQEARLRLKEQRLTLAQIPYVPAGAP